MNDAALWMLVAIVAIVVGGGLWWLWRLGREVQTERARELFRLQEERLPDVFLKVAQASGKPRGLRWLACSFAGAFVLVREKQTRKLAALVPAVLEFEPLPDGDMIDVPAATQPRAATVVFQFRKGEWVSDGRTLFNVSPEQALGLFAKDYEPVGVS